MGINLPIEEGVCLACGCTYTEPCIAKDGSTCGWANEEHNLCTFCAEELAADGMI